MGNSKSRSQQDRFLVSVSKPGNSSTQAVSFEHSPLVLFAIAGNRYNRLAGRLFKERHQESLMTWRVLGLLASKQRASVAFAAQTTGIDKAAVSRTLNQLEESGLALSEAPTADPRRKTWWLSEEGYELHEAMLVTSLELHRKLLKGLSSNETVELARLLTVVANNFDERPTD